jgi:hypothetical protein
MVGPKQKKYHQPNWPSQAKIIIFEGKVCFSYKNPEHAMGRQNKSLFEREGCLLKGKCLASKIL